MLSVAVDCGILSVNLAAGVEQLYDADRADQIWEAGEIARFAAAAPSPEVGYFVRLACLTGLRFSDLRRLAWSHVADVAIVLPTGKSRGRKTAVVPLLEPTKALIEEIRAQQARRYAELVTNAVRKGRPEPPRPLTVLSTTRCAPWSAGGAQHMINAAKTDAGIDKHLHDARGTFGTYLRRRGLSASEIADVLGWEEERRTPAGYLCGSRQHCPGHRGTAAAGRTNNLNIRAYREQQHALIACGLESATALEVTSIRRGHLLIVLTLHGRHDQQSSSRTAPGGGVGIS